LDIFPLALHANATLPRHEQPHREKAIEIWRRVRKQLENHGVQVAKGEAMEVDEEDQLANDNQQIQEEDNGLYA
jgi:hypothetical protein